MSFLREKKLEAIFDTVLSIEMYYHTKSLQIQLLSKPFLLSFPGEGGGEKSRVLVGYPTTLQAP